MEYSPKLHRQSSCSCHPLDVAGWYGSRRIRAAGFSQRLGSDEDQIMVDGELHCYPTARAAAPGMRRSLQGLWRRIVKEKRRVFTTTTSSRNAQPYHYDPYAYAQNFDEGTAWDDVEQENLSRSFSARFAVPSTVDLQRFES